MQPTTQVMHDWAVIAAVVWHCCFLFRGLDRNIKGRVCMCNIWSTSPQMLLLSGGHTVLPMGHKDSQEGGVHSTRRHRAVGLSLTSCDPQVS